MADYQTDPLWQGIDAFDLDQTGGRLTFSKRLARENGWSAGYTARVIEAYKRFCYLARRAGHPVTPSDQVDQAWHLHLTYSRSYWEDFCGRVLGQPLHHGPTRGGEREDAKYRNWYARTLASYETLFGEAPDPAVWPAPDERFRDAGAFRRINTADHWVVPKPRVEALARIWAPLIAIPLVAAACSQVTDQQYAGWAILGAVFAFILIGMVGSKRGSHRRRKKKKGDGSGGCGGGCSGFADWPRGSRRDHDTESDGNDASGCGSSGCGGGGCSGD